MYRSSSLSPVLFLPYFFFFLSSFFFSPSFASLYIPSNQFPRTLLPSPHFYLNFFLGQKSRDLYLVFPPCCQQDISLTETSATAMTVILPIQVTQPETSLRNVSVLPKVRKLPGKTQSEDCLKTGLSLFSCPLQPKPYLTMNDPMFSLFR